MAQMMINVTGLSSKADADRLVQAGEAVAGVKMVNANHEDGRVVITHGDGFDVETFKSALQDAGFATA